MTSFRSRMLLGAVFIVVAFMGFIFYALRVAPRMARDSQVALNRFYTLCKARDYRGARALMSQSLQDGITPQVFAAQWRKFEAKNGPLRDWKVENGSSINGYGGNVCVFPPFVDYRHGVAGTKGTGTLMYIRMVPENGQWRVERFNVLRH